MGVFLSFNREDDKAAKELARRLELTGESVEFERELPYGEKGWPAAVGKSIAANGAFVLIWSENAAISHIIEFEYNMAVLLKRAIFVIPVDESPLALSLIHI